MSNGPLDLISAFLNYTAAYESPTDFFYWAIIAGVASTMRDNCYLLLGSTRIYPNVYVLVLGPPAIRKAKPLNETLELCKAVNNTKIIEGRTSIQAVIQRLGEVQRLKDGRSIIGASGMIYSEELSAMLTEDDANIPVLTDIYDYKSQYTSALVSRGTTTLTNVVVTMLGASNEELLKPVFNNKAIYGGLLSRCLIVYGDRVRHRNSLMWEKAEKYDPTALKTAMLEISKLKGIFQITDAARKYYDHWYTEICPSLEKKSNKTGAEGRIHTNVLKIAMILAAAVDRKLEITIPILETAIDKCQSLFVNYKRLTMGQGRSKDADVKVLFLKILWDAGELKGYTLSRREIIHQTWGDMSSEDLDSITRNLMEGGLVIMEEKNSTVRYSLTPRAVEYFITN